MNTKTYSACLPSQIIPTFLVKNVVPDVQKMRYDFVNLWNNQERRIVFNIILHRRVRSRGIGDREWRVRTGQQGWRGGKFGDKSSVLNEKIDFQHFTNFKLLSRI